MDAKDSKSFEAQALLLDRPDCVSKYGSVNDTIDTSKELSSSCDAVTISPQSNQRVWTEAACSLVACLASLMIGMIVGFSSPTLTQLDEPEEHPSQAIKAGSIYASVFGALVPVGAMFGGLFAWPLSDALGRKPALMLGGIPSLTGWLMISLSTLITDNHDVFLGVILTGRLLAGISVGWFYFSVSVYVSEVASTKLKGLFGTCNQLFATVGVFVAYLYGVTWKGKVVKYWEFATAGAVVIVIFELLMIFTLETPRWLISKHKEEKAVRALYILRGANCDISGEVEKIKSALKQNCRIKEQIVELIGHRPVSVPFLLVLLLMFFQQFSGIVPAIFYAGPILQDAGINLDVNLVSALSIGISQVVGTLMSLFLIDCIGRRILLTVSGGGMVLSNFLMGVYFYIFKEKCGSCLGLPRDCNLTVTTSNVSVHDWSHDSPPCGTAHFGFLAIASIVFFVFTFSLGWGPIPWNAMSELMPNRVRTLAASIATCLYWSFCTIVSLFFHSYSNAVTPEGSWWTFAFIMVLAIVMVVVFLPETKGHSLEEIQEHFERGHITALPCNAGRSRPKHQASTQLLD